MSETRSTAPITVADLNRLVARLRTRAKSYRNGVVAFALEEIAEEIECAADYAGDRGVGELNSADWNDAFETAPEPRTLAAANAALKSGE